MKFPQILCYMQILQANMPQAGHRGEHFSLQHYSVLISRHVSEDEASLQCTGSLELRHFFKLCCWESEKKNYWKYKTVQ